VKFLHRLPENTQLVAELTKELNRMLEIETKLLTSFHPQTDSQIKRIN